MPCHSYIFFDTLPTIGTLPEKKLLEFQKKFAQQIKVRKEIKVEAYATLGLKVNSRFLLHINASAPEVTQLLVRDLLHTQLGKHLTVSYILTGLTRSSQYNPKKAPPPSAPNTPHNYLIVYPFTKTIEWHLLPFEQRRSIMKDHVDIGRKYSEQISQLLLYSFGIDDHEFIVSYQTDSLEAFQTLVMELRGTEARRYTEKDTPIFTCIHMPLEEALKMV